MVPNLLWIPQILLIAGVLADQLPSQCHNYQTVPGHRDRSRDNIVTDPNSAPCDNLADGSYRFRSGEISTSCVPVNHCGTVSTMWMKDSIPDIGQTSYNEFCVNHKSSSSHGDPCCLFSFRVNVTNCHGFLVYDFRSDDVLCPSGYCTENITTCPPGETSTTGFAPCVESYPVMQGPPTLEAPVLSANGQDFSQTCVVHHNGSRAEFKVTWLFDEKEYKTRILRNGTTRDSLQSKDWIGHVGQNVRCQVTSYIRYSPEASHSPTLYSKSYFGGIVGPSTTIIVEEDTQREVTLVSSLPVVCKNAPRDKCHQDLQIFIQGVKPNGIMVVNGCSLEMRTDDWDSMSHQVQLNLTLTTGVDFMLHPGTDYLVKINIPNDVDHPMWSYYQVQDIKVMTRDKPFHLCFAVGDLHIGYTDLYLPGDYLFYKAHNLYGNILQVQVRLWSPHHQGSSICAVAVQYNEALIMVDMCTTRVNMTAPVITQGEITPDDLRVYRCGAEYRILAGDGVQVVIHLYEHHMDLKLDLPPSYPSNVDGVCSTATYRPPTHFLPLNNSLSWNLHPNESFFIDGHLEFYKVRPQRTRTSQRFCACRSTSTCDPIARFVHPLCTMYGRNMKCESPCEIVTPHAVNPEHGAFTVGDPRDYGNPTQNWPNMTTDTAKIRSICRSMITRSLPTRCQSHAGIMNINTALCIEDYKASGGFEFADSAVLGAMWDCEYQDFPNHKLYHQASDGIFYFKNDLALTYCPDHCNGNGDCVGGRCVCSSGFKAEDCSIVVGTPPQIIGVKGGMICGMSSLYCLDPILITRDVENSDKLIAHITIIETQLGQLVSTNKSLLLEPKYDNKYSVSLPMSSVLSLLNEKTAFGVYISISNDGKTFSEPALYTVYDDKCVYCNIQPPAHVHCFQKESTCHIDGKCYLNGETNPTNASEVCNPGIGLVRWSVSSSLIPTTASSGKSPAPSTSTTSTSSTVKPTTGDNLFVIG